MNPIVCPSECRSELECQVNLILLNGAETWMDTKRELKSQIIVDSETYFASANSI